MPRALGLFRWALVGCLMVLLFCRSSDAFSVHYPLKVARTIDSSTVISGSSSSVPEYSVWEEDFEEEKQDKTPSVQAKTPYLVETSETAPTEKAPSSPTPSTNKDTPNTGSSKPVKTQYAALEPGTVVQIQVGDVSLARKAWKKRRRSGSPLLVPCSVLSVDRDSAIRWNLMYLLAKFGSGSHKSIRLSCEELTRRHVSHLQSSLMQHAEALGYATVDELVRALFPKSIQDTYGIKLVVKDDDRWLQAPISRRRAQKRAERAVLLQVTPDKQQQDTLQHTGWVRNRNIKNDGPRYQYCTLSAALRVTQEEMDSLEPGSQHAAVVLDYDLTGDAGAPLLTLSLNPARNKVGQKMVNPNYETISQPNYLLSQLSVGQGLVGKVVRLQRNVALVDCQVGCSTNLDDDYIKVYGILRFVDAIRSLESDMDQGDEWNDIFAVGDLEESEVDEQSTDTRESVVLDQLEDDDKAEDITHLFYTNPDGSLVYENPETGETEVMPMSDKNDSWEEKWESDVSEAALTETDGSTNIPENVPSPLLYSHRRRQWLNVGDEVEVFVKSKQSGQLFVTMDSSIRGKKAKQVKRELATNKKLARLEKQLGGLHRMEQLRGQECDGVVKAASHTGDWFYVEPVGTTEYVPVGVATAPPECVLHQGDAVRIKIEGIDQNRGQLAMRVLGKLEP